MLAIRRACAARICQRDGSDDWASATARLIDGCDDKWWREKMHSTILVILAVSSPLSDSGEAFTSPCWPGRHVDKQKLLFQTQALNGELRCFRKVDFAASPRSSRS